MKKSYFVLKINLYSLYSIIKQPWKLNHTLVEYIKSVRSQRFAFQNDDHEESNFAVAAFDSFL